MNWDFFVQRKSHNLNAKKTNYANLYRSIVSGIRKIYLFEHFSKMPM